MHPTPTKLTTGAKVVAWASAHKVLSAIIVLVLIGAIGAAASGGNSTSSTSSSSNSSTSQQQSGQSAQASSAPKAPTATAKPKSWKTTQHFSGDSNTQTPTFHINDGDRIVWSYTPTDPQANGFSATLTSASDNTPIDLLAAYADDAGHNSTYNVHESADVYLTITADSCNWTIDVQAYQ